MNCTLLRGRKASFLLPSCTALCQSTWKLFDNWWFRGKISSNKSNNSSNGQGECIMRRELASIVLALLICKVTTADNTTPPPSTTTPQPPVYDGPPPSTTTPPGADPTPLGNQALDALGGLSTPAALEGFPGVIESPTIGLSLENLTPKVLPGGTAEVLATVSNTGTGELDYTIGSAGYAQSDTVEGSTTSMTGFTLAELVDLGAEGVNLYPEVWTIAQQIPSDAAPGTLTIAGIVTAPEASNSATIQTTTVQVLRQPTPVAKIGGQQISLTAAVSPPPVTTEQASATGGGSYSAAAPALLGDPDAPAADLDLDTINAVGDPEITLTLQPFTDLISDDVHEVDSYVDVDGSVPGIYTTTFDFGFSDEQDIPGADAPGSILGSYTVVADVTGDGVTVTFLFPEPGLAMPALLGAAALFQRRRPLG
jgi:hypothetical protein